MNASTHHAPSSDIKRTWAKALLTQVTGLAMLARAGEIDAFWEGLDRATAWKSRSDVQAELLRALVEAGGDDVPVDREAEIAKFLDLVRRASGPGALERLAETVPDLEIVSNRIPRSDPRRKRRAKGA